MAQKKPDTQLFSYSFEEAVALTENGIFHYQLLLTCGICFLTYMCQLICVGTVLPYIACDLNATIAEQSVLTSAGFYGMVCSSHIMGFLGDTWGRVRTTRWSIITSTLVSVISAFSMHIWMLIVLRFLTGFFAAGCQACILTICGEFHSNKTRSRHVTMVSVFLPVSLIYVPLQFIIILALNMEFTVYGFVMSTWRFLILAVNILAIYSLILLCFIPETPKYDLVHGNHEKSLNTLRKMYKRNTKRPIEEYPVLQIRTETIGANIADIHGCGDAIKMVWRQTIALFYKDLIWHTLNICFILFVTYGVSQGFIMWYPSILKDIINRNGDFVCTIISECNRSGKKVGSTIAWLMVFVGCAFTVIYLLSACTIQAVGKKNMLIFWLVICGSFCIAIHWISNFVVAVIALTIISAVGNCGGIIGTIAVDFFPTNINAMSVCLIMMIGRLGAAAGSNLTGLFLFKYCDIMFWIISAILFMLAIMSFFLPEKKTKTLDDEQ